MADTNYDRQNPAFYVSIGTLILMSSGTMFLLLRNSFKLDVDITSGGDGLLFMPTIRNYETASCDILWYEPKHLRFCTIRFAGAFINSLTIALVLTALTLVFGCMAAYALVRLKFIGRGSAT